MKPKQINGIFQINTVNIVFNGKKNKRFLSLTLLEVLASAKV